MEISYGLVDLMYFMLCGELSRIKGSRSNKRRKLLTCFTNSLFKVYNNLSLRETGPEVYNRTKEFLLLILRGWSNKMFHQTDVQHDDKETS